MEGKICGWKRLERHKARFETEEDGNDMDMGTDNSTTAPLPYNTTFNNGNTFVIFAVLST